MIPFVTNYSGHETFPAGFTFVFLVTIGAREDAKNVSIEEREANKNAK
jgi:hypothetical protein